MCSSDLRLSERSESERHGAVATERSMKGLEAGEGEGFYLELTYGAGGFLDGDAADGGW